MSHINRHPAPGIGDLLPGFYVVPQNPIRAAQQGIGYVPHFGELVPAMFTVPDNPLVKSLAGLGSMGCNGGCSGSSVGGLLRSNAGMMSISGLGSVEMADGGVLDPVSEMLGKVNPKISEYFDIWRSNKLYFFGSIAAVAYFLFFAGGNYSSTRYSRARGAVKHYRTSANPARRRRRRTRTRSTTTAKRRLSARRRSANPRRKRRRSRNAAGFMSGGVFHPIRSGTRYSRYKGQTVAFTDSRPYSRKRAGEGPKRKAKARRAAPRRKTGASRKRRASR